MEIILLLLRLFLAAIFALAGIGKFLDLKGSEKAVKDFGVPDNLAKVFAFALPATEILIALFLLPASTAWFGAIGAFLLLVAFVGGMIWQMAKGNAPDCHCFGQIHSEPVSPKSLIRNGVFALLAFFLVLRGNNNLSLADLTNELALQLILGLGVIALLGTVVFYLKKLSEQLVQVTRRIEVIELLSHEGSSLEREDFTEPRAGLPIGTPAPDFALPNIAGREVSFEHLLMPGKPLVLFFVSPTCNPCAELLPEIEIWQKDLKDRFNFVFISSGDAQANAEKFGGTDLKQILLQKDKEVSELFSAEWTPTALVVNAEGKVVSHPAVGDAAIRELIEKVKAENPESEYFHVANGNGSKIGEDAPDFALEDLRGKQITARDLQGAKTLVTFWSMTCPYCVEMIDEFKEWEKERAEDDPQLLILSGSKAKAHEDLDLDSPVLLDEDHKVADKFGMDGTPSALLVNEEGKIVSEIAVGATQIWALIGKRK